jgi:DNA-directed RNA polymerase specialized sigma24 family protein
MNSTGPVDRLIEIWADPRIRGLARRWAGNAETADDAMQSTFEAIARLPRLTEIENLRGYFIQVLRRMVYRELGQLNAVLADDFTRIAEERRSTPSFEDDVCTSLQGRARYERFCGERDRLMLKVSARSADPARYRAVIGDAAEQVLQAGMRGEPSEADLPPALRAAYPEYFAQPGVSVNTCDQRYHRARQDVMKLLKAVVPRSELSGD